MSIDPDNLAIVWYDEENQILTLLSNDTTVDKANNSVYVVTNHFSKYGVVDKEKWLEMWNTKLPAVRTSNVHYNIVLAMDCSGSMYGDAMSNSIKSAQNLVDTLRDGDQVAIVAFGSYSREILPSTIIQSNTRNTIKNALDSLKATDNDTIIGSALSYSLRYAVENENYYSLVILLSDGRSYDVSNNIFNSLNEKNMRVITVGLGSYVDNALLTKIAESTNGTYFFAQTANNLQEKFNEIAENELGSNLDSDGDGLSDSAEKEGMRDQWGYHIKTDPNNVDADEDGLNDDMEIGVYDPATKTFTRLSDPSKTTIISNLSYISSAKSDTSYYYPEDKSVLLMTVFYAKRILDYGDTEYLYKIPESLQCARQYSNNYTVVDSKFTFEDLKDGRRKYICTVMLSYKNSPGKNDNIKWRLSAPGVRFVSSGTRDQATEYIEWEQNIISDPVGSYDDLAEKIEANLAMVEKAFIDIFSSNAEAALQKTDNNQDLKSKLESVKKKLVIRPTSISTVPEEVCEAFALSVLSGFYSSGSKSEKYNSDNSTLFNQLIEEIGNTVQNGEFKVVVKEQLYRVKYTSLNALSTGIGVEFAWVYLGDSNASVAIISWGSSFEEMKSALAGYCAKLAELNKDILNDLVVSYVHGAFKDLGIGLNKKTVKNFFKLAEQTIKAINGDKGAIKEYSKNIVEHCRR
ncbi:MAG: VWA domain-containing protein [Synergistaceae bacterium]|nr:VWA domain-containing protein [Synergistaceae bacterium]